MFDHPVHVPPGLRCCGSPMEKIGDEVRRTALVEENRTHLRHFSRVVSSCPGCTAQLIDRYGIDAMHIVEYLYEVIGTKKISRSAKPRSLKVALHHPCHLNRIIGPHTKDYAISLVQALPGVVLIDTSDSESCCGAGGSLLSGYPEVASRMALEKVRNASTSGAELLVAACPFCVTNLGRAGGIEVMDLTDLIHDFVLRA